MMLMPRIFDDDFFRDDFFRGKDKMHNQIMKTDIQEDEHAYTLDIDLPGYNKEDIKIDVTNGYLTISAKTNHEEKDEKSNYVRRERFLGECCRSFYVGEDIKADEIKASFKNGILNLVVPKVNPEDESPEKKYIEIED